MTQLDAQRSPGSARWLRWLPGASVLVLGIVAGQAVLYGPSLTGRKVLLPLDILTLPYILIPRDAGLSPGMPHDFVLFDLVSTLEPGRCFAAGEIQAGRIPLWNPYQFAGAPFLFPKFSPIWLLGTAFSSPVVVAWMQMMVALIAGTGAYIFCRRVLQVSFWPATIVAWCYPLTGFFVLWQGYPIAQSILWFPWLLLAIDRTIRQASRWSGVLLAAATCLVLITGQLDVVGQHLLASGLFAIWCYFDAYGKRWLSRRAVGAAASVVAGWSLGVLLAAPHLLPILEYTRTGSRMTRRSQGEEERPPVGLAALPQAIVPDIYGSNRVGSLLMGPEGQGNQIESSAMAYAGLLATLFVAPLAYCSRRHRSINLFWLFLCFFALSWTLNVPGIVSFLRLPLLNMMSHNRFVFAASFAVLSLAAVGLDLLWQRNLSWRTWFWLPVLLLLVLCGWAVFRMLLPPEPIASQVESSICHGQPMAWITDLAGVQQLQWNYFKTCFCTFVLGTVALGGWLALRLGWKSPRWFACAIGSLMIADLLWFGYDRNPQCDWAQYYPRVPVLEHVSRAPPGRIIGCNCLPAVLSQMYHLADIRGYDAVDPARMIDVLKIAADPQSCWPPYGLTQCMIPKCVLVRPAAVRLHPVLDMLSVRYVIFRGEPPAGVEPDFCSPDYWALTNPRALPRAFVPEHVETIAEDERRLVKMADDNFDPRTAAYVESELSLPAMCRGSATIIDDTPQRVRLSVEMETPGLVVLGDRWDKGWHAYLNGEPAPILPTNHVLRGVSVPAGKSSLEFRYAPASLRCGLWLGGLALVVLAGWSAAGFRMRRSHASGAGSLSRPTGPLPPGRALPPPRPAG
ncbi:MAG: hypothetical protein ABSF26_05680 [Thermoguttaceae bacterium]